MKHGEKNTLESILEAARTMVKRNAAEPGSEADIAEHEYERTEKEDKTDNAEADSAREQPPEQESFETVQPADQSPKAENLSEASGAREDAEETPDTDAAMDTDVYAQTPLPPADYTADIHTVGIHFLEFAVAFLTLSKCQYHSSSLKVSSLPFFTLVALDNWAEKDYTMSELAEKLQITKQQLSKMINMLEEKGLVERIHDRENRRRVYIRICDAGREMMDDLKQEMLESTLWGLRPYSQEELLEMDSCICRLIKLMEKFNTDPLQEDNRKKADHGE